jgi:hypothetical protein
VTVGLYLYELHNMNRCHELIEQGAKCEKWLTKDGPVQFFDKPREKKLVKAAAGVVYGAVCFGWLCVATLAANPGEQDKARSVAFRPFVIRRVPMPNDIEVLLRLNLEIGTKESEGDKDWFEGKVAPVLAFQRANSKREVVDRQAFLNGVAKSDPVQMRETEVDSIHVYGNRAVVTCIVAWKGKRFHNVRLFVRRPPEMEWELLGWANEPAP